MTKTEIIQATLAALRQGDATEQGTSNTECADIIADDEASVVIPTLVTRLPDDVDIKTCADFSSLGVACCSTCHSLYPHFEMYLDDTPDGSKAWICCSVQRAMRGESGCSSEELLQLEQALGGTSRDRWL